MVWYTFISYLLLVLLVSNCITMFAAPLFHLCIFVTIYSIVSPWFEMCSLQIWRGFVHGLSLEGS